MSRQRPRDGAADSSPDPLQRVRHQVHDAWVNERLTPEQRRRHLRRIGIGTSTPVAATAPRSRWFARRLSGGQTIPVPPDQHWEPPRRSRPVLEIAAAIMAFVAIGAVLMLIFRDPAIDDRLADDLRPLQAPATPEGWTDASVWLPGGGQIAFSRLDDGRPQIAVVYADGSGLQTLSTNAHSNTGPSWSPDGQAIAFSAVRDGAPQVYTMHADGSGIRQRTSYTWSTNPVWSPDGTQIAVISRREDRIGLYVLRADGSGERNLSGLMALDGTETPRWSPDSQRLVFASRNAIYIVGLEDATPRLLTQHPAGDVMPEWSPDGRWVVFTSYRDGNAELYLIDPNDTGDVRRLTDTPDNERFPVWSPDGREVVYSFEPHLALPGTEVYLHIMDADGGNQRRLVSLRAATPFAPAWSPDSSRIAFAVQPYGTNANTLFVVNRDGSGLRNLPVVVAGIARPVWRPVWWPEYPPQASSPSQPSLSLSTAQGGCDTEVIATGTGFEPGSTVRLYGAPVPGGSFATLGEPVIVDANGGFTIPVDVGQAAACANDGSAATGEQFHIGVTIERGMRQGAFLSDLSATTTYTFIATP